MNAFNVLIAGTMLGNGISKLVTMDTNHINNLSGLQACRISKLVTMDTNFNKIGTVTDIDVIIPES